MVDRWYLTELIAYWAIKGYPFAAELQLFFKCLHDRQGSQFGIESVLRFPAFICLSVCLTVSSSSSSSGNRSRRGKREEKDRKQTKEGPDVALVDFLFAAG